jgi:serine/threonine-protein kinase
MTPERWAAVKALFARAVDLDDPVREAVLTEFDGDPCVRDEVRALLAAEREAAAFDTGALTVLVPADTGAPLRERIGPYSVLREIGRGGMGIVYLAARSDQGYRREVAVKVLRPGLLATSVGARFAHERRTLASLEHPSIARLYDGGTTADGEAYFAMEYVDGEPIDRYCAGRALPIEATLRLFMAVCGAVEYAHRNLVVHRDLKADNILVDGEGVPHLLDFGIAKLLEAAPEDTNLTLDAGRALTPDYASPEQVRGEPVTTATDVYSLGVLLYRLVSGRPPYRVASSRPRDIEAAVLETVPLPPSRLDGLPPRLRRRLSGDLDTIVGVALHKDPARRYPSVAALRDDLERHLAGHPVHARADSWAYRASCFVRRHAVAVAVSAAVAIALASTGGMALWQARVARAEADRARQINAFVREMLGAANPYVEPSRVTVPELLDRASERAARQLAAQPAVQAAVLTTIGESYLGLGRYDAATTTLRRALALTRASGGSAREDEVSALRLLGEVAREQGDFTAAEERGREAVALARTLPAAAQEPLAAALNGLGSTLLFKGRLPEAAAAHREALSILDRVGRRRTVFGAEAINDLAVVLGSQQDPAAEALHREAVAICRDVLGPDHPHTAGAVNALASYLADRGSLEEADRLFAEALRVRRAVLTPGHPDLAFVLYGYAYLQLDRRDFARAIALAREVLAMRGRTLPETNQLVHSTLQLVGQAELLGGDPRTAEASLRECLELRRRTMPGDHWTIASTEGWLGRALAEQGRVAEARPLIASSYERLRSRLPETHGAVVEARRRAERWK